MRVPGPRGEGRAPAGVTDGVTRGSAGVPRTPPVAPAAVVLRQQLAEARRAGLRFEAAWPAALAVALQAAGRERGEWVAVLTGMTDVWRQSRIRNVRIQDLLDQRITEHEQRTGERFAELARRALYRELEVGDLEAAMIDSLGDFITVTLALHPNGDGEPTVEVVDVERRTEVLGRPRNSKTPFTRLVRVQATPERSGRTGIELVGLPPDFATVRVFVAALPSDVRATVTVRIDDLNPALRPVEDAA
jgi:hypothetical protein